MNGTACPQEAKDKPPSGPLPPIEVICAAPWATMQTIPSPLLDEWAIIFLDELRAFSLEPSTMHNEDWPVDDMGAVTRSLRAAFDTLLGAPSSGNIWTQATLPVAKGGLGLQIPPTARLRPA